MNNFIVTTTRGDTCKLEINLLNCIDEVFTTDTFYFGLMDPNQPFEQALVKHKYDAETHFDFETYVLTITLPADDTYDLIPGKYYYAIKLHHYKNDDTEFVDEVITVVPKSKFVICD